MPRPRKDSDVTERAMDEAKHRQIEMKSSGTDNTAKNDEPASPQTVLNEVIDEAVVKAEQVKSLGETTAETVDRSTIRETIPSQSKVPPAVYSNIDSTKAIATEETMVPTFESTFTSPDKIKEEPKTTGASGISKGVERKIEIEQNIEKLPQTPGCEEPEKTNVPEKVELKSSEGTAVKEDKLTSETKTQKESELPKFDTNIDLSKTESVPEKSAPNVSVSDRSTGKSKDESKEKIKSPVASKKDDRIFVAEEDQKSEIQAIGEVENQMSEVPRSETCLKTDLDESKSLVEVPEPSSIGIADSFQELILGMHATDRNLVTATKPVCSKASDDSPPSNIDLKGLSSDGESTKSRKYPDLFGDREAFFESLLRGDRKKPLLKITKPDFTYVSTRLQQTVMVKQGKFQVYLDVSQFDIKNIHLSIEDGKIHVCARQENETEFGLEYHAIQQIFKIPNHVNSDKFSACIDKDCRLLVEAPILIPSDSSK